MLTNQTAGASKDEMTIHFMIAANDQATIRAAALVVHEKGLLFDPVDFDFSDEGREGDARNFARLCFSQVKIVMTPESFSAHDLTREQVFAVVDGIKDAMGKGIVVAGSEPGSRDVNTIVLYLGGAIDGVSALQVARSYAELSLELRQAFEKGVAYRNPVDERERGANARRLLDVAGCSLQP